MNFAEIALDLPVFQNYTYAIPDKLQGKLKIGSLVTVPFGRGNQLQTGVCISLTDVKVPRIKPIRTIIGKKPVINAKMIEICAWISQYYACPLGEVLATAIPPGIKRGTAARLEQVYQLTGNENEVSSRAKRQKEIIAFLAEKGGNATSAELKNELGVSSGILKTMRDNGFIKREPVLPAPEIHVELQGEDVKHLTAEQEEAMQAIHAAIDAQKFRPVLIKGITGSGKTEIYLRAIDRVVKQGGTAIILVPEIVLTPQMSARFSRCFERIAIMHSRLSQGERAAIWRGVQDGLFDVVIGPRSALFAPLENPGIIIVDEEHENSFKQENNPRYNARDLAIYMGSVFNIPVLLGSATPSLESIRNADLNRYQLLELKNRVGGYCLPQMHVIDMAEEYRDKKAFSVLSLPLAQRIDETLQRNEQAIIFLNQRGFSRFVFCPVCAKPAKCKHCDITLTYHKGNNRYICHYCGFFEKAYTECRACNYSGLVRSGTGTQKLEEDLAVKYPGAVIERVDSDSMTSRERYRDVLTRFARNEIHIFVGTQIVAKGLDFPNVTTVGIIGIENALNLPDFRAPERTFQMISQVSGRAGRGNKAGHVYLEVFDAAHYAIDCAVAGDAERFYAQENALRRELNYPPFGSLVRLIIEGPDEYKTRNEALALRDRLRGGSFPVPVRMLGPVETPLFLIKGKYRFHLLLKVPDRIPLNGLFPDPKICSAKPPVRITIDVDPVSML